MIVQKDARGETDGLDIRTVKLCAEPGAVTTCECPWGRFYEALLFMNGFPYKRILRKNRTILESQVEQWLADPAAEWDDVTGVAGRAA